MTLLTRAGVVDAGALGFALLLDAIAAYLSGRQPAPLPEGLGEVDPAWRPEDEATSRFGHCLRFSLTVPVADADLVRRRLAVLAGSVVVAGAGRRLSVHLHTADVPLVLEAVAALGQVEEITDEDIDSAAADFFSTPPTAVVAVVLGDGWRRLFESFGAFVVEDGSQVAAAVAVSRAADVIVLSTGVDTNSPAGAHRLDVADPAAGLAALLAFDSEAGIEPNVEAMTRAAAAVTVVAVNGEAVLALEPPASTSLLTLYHGDRISAGEAGSLASSLRLLHPSLEVEAVYGGQASPDYLIAFQA
jgi:dihydroxyacetone kinase-like predicted kinase